jgi:hypothetical protein
MRLRLSSRDRHRFPTDLGLTEVEAQIALLFATLQDLTSNQILLHLYGAAAGAEPKDRARLRVFVCTLRRKLAAREIAIQTRRYYGWSVSDDDRRRLDAMIRRSTR